MPRDIYAELTKTRNKLTAFCNFLIDKKVVNNKGQALWIVKNPTPAVMKLYAEWAPGKIVTKDMTTYVERTKEVFKEMKTKQVRAEVESIVDVLEEALKETSLAIKHNDLGRLPEVKRLLEEALYARKTQ